ncbi:MAG: hypothetical protein IH780_04450 [Thaumarchaeota archaeon]|nr:hypothetical protein [Nitrososphaerota archaeon]
MNWFKRDKPKEEKSTDKELPQNGEIKLEVEQFHEEQIDNSQYKNGSEELENEIESKKQHLESISKKLTDVKQEYDLAVENLIHVKKDLIMKNKELSSLRAISGSNPPKTATSDQLKESIELEDIQTQIKKSKVELDVVKNEEHKSESKLIEVQALLKKSEKELGRIDLNKKELLKDIQLEQKKSKNKEKKPGEDKESKRVIEAASAAIASMKNKLKIAETELATVKQVLEKERKEHQEAKKSKKLNEKNNLK